MLLLGGQLHAVGPAVTTDGSEIYALNAETADTLIHVHVPATICALLDDELHCNEKRGCTFCDTGLNDTHCYAAVDDLPARSVCSVT